MNNNYKRILIISTSLILTVCLFFQTSVFAAAPNGDLYEYNDLYVYANGTLIEQTALGSNNFYQEGATFELHVVGSRDQQNNLDLNIYMAGGSSTWNDTIARSNNSGSIRVVIGGVEYRYITFSPNSTIVPILIDDTPTQGWPAIEVYISTSGSKLDTPSPTVNGNTISWSAIPNADGYNIRWANDNIQFTETVAQNLQTTSYVVNKTGYYKVQAEASGLYTDSDWSSTVYIEYDPTGGGSGDNSTGIIDWLTSGIARIFSTVAGFFSNLLSFISQIGGFFGQLTAFLPQELSDLLWSMVGILFVLGFIHLVI